MSVTEEVPNGGVYVEMVDDNRETKRAHQHHSSEITLYGVLHRMLMDILYPDSGSSPLWQRIKSSVYNNGPLVQEGARNSSRNVLIWTKRGSPLRALFVISVSTITLLSLTGLLVFTLFFVTATVNAVIISLLISLAAAGGFLAFFFACVTAIYIGALSVAVFVISAATMSAVIAVLIATGWIGFFWIVWITMRKSVGLAKHSLSVTGTALSAYSSARRHGHHYHQEVDKKD